MSDIVRYPQEGCIVEYLEGNSFQIALVLEETDKRLRLLLPNRRELTLSKNRILPWVGPLCQKSEGREAAIRALEQHRDARAQTEATLDIRALWDMVQGELREAQAQWFAELEVSDPSADTVAAYGHALVQCKTHFRFQPPVFEIFSPEEVEKREREQAARLEREALLGQGRAFLALLWDVWQGKKSLQAGADIPLDAVCARLKELLFTLMRVPTESLPQGTHELWGQLSRGLPDVPQLPLQLLIAWGHLPPHYDVWLDTSGYANGDAWWQPCAAQVEDLVQAAKSSSELPFVEACFLSIDSATTNDIDDAFALEADGDGWLLTVALAAPSLFWPFDTPLDALVAERGSSLYLPEQTCHMLPECLGTDAFSLRAAVERPAFLLTLGISSDGALTSCTPRCARIRLAANLTYEACEQVLAGEATADNPALPYAEQLSLALAMATCRQDARIRDGAVCFERPEPHIGLEGEGAETRVTLTLEADVRRAQMIVSESMIAAGAACGAWAKEQNIPLLYRTQDVALPRSAAGCWSAPERIAELMHALLPSILELQPARHAALGIDAYAPVTSPLRRYADLLNLAQIAAVLRENQACFSAETLQQKLSALERALDHVGTVQRMRPRYWKLLYFRQQGDRVWWPGVITEENEVVAVVNLPKQGITLRSKRQLFDDNLTVGMPVRVRIGKVQPYWNEIQIVEALPEEAC